MESTPPRLSFIPSPGIQFRKRSITLARVSSTQIVCGNFVGRNIFSHPRVLNFIMDDNTTRVCVDACVMQAVDLFTTRKKNYRRNKQTGTGV